MLFRSLKTHKSFEGSVWFYKNLSAYNNNINLFELFVDSCLRLVCSLCVCVVRKCIHMQTEEGEVVCVVLIPVDGSCYSIYILGAEAVWRSVFT